MNTGEIIIRFFMLGIVIISIIVAVIENGKLISFRRFWEKFVTPDFGWLSMLGYIGGAGMMGSGYIVTAIFIMLGFSFAEQIIRDKLGVKAYEDRS